MNVEDLPSGIIGNICEFLTTQEIFGTLCLISQEFLQSIRYTQHCFDISRLCDVPRFISTVKGMNLLYELTLGDCRHKFGCDDLQNINEQTKSLRVLKVGNSNFSGFLSLGGFAQLEMIDLFWSNPQKSSFDGVDLSDSPDLKVLKLRNTGIYDASKTLDTICSKKLQELDLSGCKNISHRLSFSEKNKDCFKKLEILNLSKTQIYTSILENLLPNVPSLTELKVSQCPNLGNTKIEHHKLERISCEGCRKFNLKAINCISLKYVNYGGGSSYSHVFKNLLDYNPHIEEVQFYSCYHLEDLRGVGGSGGLNLKVANFNYSFLDNQSIHRIVRVCPQLRELHVKQTHLHNAGFVSESLQIVDISGNRITTDSVEEMMQGCPYLQRLNVSTTDMAGEWNLKAMHLKYLLMRNVGVTAVRFECPNLIELVVFNVPIKSDSVERICRGSPMLEQLRVERCENFREINIKHDSLQFLSLAESYNMYVCNIKGKEIRKIDFGGCFMLTTFKEFECEKLEECRLSKCPAELVKQVSQKFPNVKLPNAIESTYQEKNILRSVQRERE